MSKKLTDKQLRALEKGRKNWNNKQKRSKKKRLEEEKKSNGKNSLG